MLDDFRKRYGRASEVDDTIEESFVEACLWLFVEAFSRAKQTIVFDVNNWHETQYSAHLIGFMDKIRDENDINLQIDPECYQYHQDILNGKADPDTAPRIDIRLKGGWVARDKYFGIEAKLLVEKDWQSKNASQLRRRYIETGIDNFVSGRYSPIIPRGCIAGYVINGDAEKIRKALNRLLRTRSRESEKLENKHSINGCDTCYDSEHQRSSDGKYLKLNHVLLPFA